MKDKGHIEEVFKKAFENHEASVPDGLFSKIQNQMNQGSATPDGSSAASGSSGSTAGVAGSGLSGMAVTGMVAGALAIAGSVFYFYNQDDENTTVNDETVETVLTDNQNMNTAEQNEGSPQLGDESIAFEDAAGVTDEEGTPQVEEAKQGQNFHQPDLSGLRGDVQKPSQPYNGNQPGNDSESNPATTADNSSENTPASTGGENSVTDESNPVTTETSENSIEADAAAFKGASLRASVMKGTAPLEVEFSLDADLSGDVEWEFADLELVKGNHKQGYTFEEAGIYEIGACLGNECKTIIIEVEPKVVSKLGPLPNIFSPNNDGDNDFYVVPHDNLVSYNLQVLNKQGKTVFETRDPKEHWGGFDNFGNRLPEGSYICIVFAVGEDGEEYVLRESVKLIR